MLQETPAPPTKGASVGLLRRFRSEMEYYSSKILRIQTKVGTVTPLRPNLAQRILQARVSAQLRETGRVRALVLKARQEGISTWVAARVYRGCQLYGSRNALVVGDKDERSAVLYRIYDRFRVHSPAEVRPATRTTRRAQELLFDRRHGGGLDSQIAVETAGGKEPGRAMTRWYIHLSEFAFYKEQAVALVALLQTVPQGSGEIYIESTANGVGDEFHAMWRAAEAGESGWLPIFLPWWIHEEYRAPLSAEELAGIEATTDPWERMALHQGIAWDAPGDEVPVAAAPSEEPEHLESGATWDASSERWRLSPEQLHWRRRKISDDFGGDSRRFRQEFPATAREAFLVSGNAYFDEEALLDYEERTREPIARGNWITVGGGGIAFRAAERGYVRLYEPPDPEGHYVIAADTAEGKLAAARDTSLSDPEGERGGRDFCSADVLKLSEMRTDEAGKPVRVACRRQVAHVHGRMAPEVFAEALWAAGSYYSCPGPVEQRTRRQPALVAPERNHSSGQSVIRILRERYGYRSIYVHRQMNVRKGRPTVHIGWVTDANTRMPMLDELSAHIRKGTIEIPCAETIAECFTFVRGDDGRPEAQEGCHDDRVISLAIAVQMERYHRDEPVGELPEPALEQSLSGDE